MGRERSFKSSISINIHAAAIPAARARDSKTPTIKNGSFGTDNISFVTIPARYLKYKIEKYTATYLQKKKCYIFFVQIKTRYIQEFE